MYISESMEFLIFPTILHIHQIANLLNYKLILIQKRASLYFNTFLMSISTETKLGFGVIVLSCESFSHQICPVNKNKHWKYF